MSTQSNPDNLTAYPVWQRSVRIFHWVNVLCFIGLMGIGLVLFNDDALGISGDGKILLKTLHVSIGYVFCLNLVWRLVGLFIGNRYARLKAVFPMGSAYFSELKSYITGMKSRNAPPYLGHNPAAKAMVAFLFLLLTTQAVTGLVLAGTDIYYPPFGNAMAEWVTGGDKDKLAKLKPGSKEFVDMDQYKEMRAFRKPFITTHKFSFYLLLFAVTLHIAAVVITEIREKNGLVSAMFTGSKVFRERPVDLGDDS
ncbi:MAG: cytochrome b/b6 domain-containing protein [Gammaproteobacteria bacterium]